MCKISWRLGKFEYWLLATGLVPVYTWAAMVFLLSEYFWKFLKISGMNIFIKRFTTQNWSPLQWKCLDHNVYCEIHLKMHWTTMVNYIAVSLLWYCIIQLLDDDPCGSWSRCAISIRLWKPYSKNENDYTGYDYTTEQRRCFLINVVITDKN